MDHTYLTNLSLSHSIYSKVPTRHVPQGQLQCDPRVFGQIQPPSSIPRPRLVQPPGRDRVHPRPLRHPLGPHHVCPRVSPAQHLSFVGQTASGQLLIPAMRGPVNSVSGLVTNTPSTTVFILHLRARHKEIP